jgi:hypothetical protein
MTRFQLASDVKKAKDTLALIKSLRSFLRDPVSLERARHEIEQSLAVREASFLELVHTCIYERPKSPYLKLLKFAGCAYADLETHVRRYGLETCLEKLANNGVYLTSEEFKGKKTVVRGSHSFSVSPGDFEIGHSLPGYVGQSSGTTNKPVRSRVHTNYLSQRTYAACVFFAAHDLFSYVHAIYDAILPGAAGVNNLLIYSRLGIAADRWFARRIPVRSWAEGFYHSLMTYSIVLSGKCFGPGFPAPRYTKTTDLARIVQWMIEMKASLQGVKFIVSGEPYTEAKRSAIEKAGATATSRYSYGGSVNIGFGCGNPLHIDEIHVNQHMLALITHRRCLDDQLPSVQPLLCTTLVPSVSRLLLNVESGDYATLENRKCKCALEDAGLTLHVHHIRSFEKFTSEGMNYFYGDLFEFFENTLPATFGGGPGDYQLVEEEDSDGQTYLTLVVAPTVASLNESKLLAKLQAALANGSRANQFMAKVWQQAGAIRIKRAVPHTSPRGKVLPLHVNQ